LSLNRLLQIPPFSLFSILNNRSLFFMVCSPPKLFLNRSTKLKTCSKRAWCNGQSFSVPHGLFAAKVLIPHGLFTVPLPRMMQHLLVLSMAARRRFLRF
jgi:hypothetical protein